MVFFHIDTHNSSVAAVRSYTLPLRVSKNKFADEASKWCPRIVASICFHIWCRTVALCGFPYVSNCGFSIKQEITWQEFDNNIYAKTSDLWEDTVNVNATNNIQYKYR